MFFYDHAMSRDDEMYHSPEPEPMGELDMLDGLRAMSMFKKDPGPLGPMDINQDVKHALACNPHCFMEMASEGFMSQQLIREIEQMIEDKMPDSERYGNMLPSSMGGAIASVAGPFPSQGYQISVKSKNPNYPSFEIGNPKKKLKAESMRRATIPNLL
tara:strand:+ start:1515 stop:1988 length:474 start_codon:yes stop_codon:yes gene_type:complete